MICWILSILAILYIIIPNTDDANYGLPAISFIANGHLARPVGPGGYEYAYYVFPTLSFIESGCYWIFNQLHIPLNFYTYRIPIALFFVGLLLLGAKNLKYAASHTTLRQILWLSLVGITLFAQTWNNNRPETPALFFLMLHLTFFYSWITTRKRHLLPLSGLSLGMVVALHPEFLPVVAITFLIDCYILHKHHDLIAVTLIILAATIPLLAVTYFYVLHAPRSWEVLFNQVNVASHAAPFHKFWSNMAGSGMPLSLRIINLLFFVPTLAITAYSVLRSINLLRIKESLPPLQLHAIGFLISAFLVLKMSWGYPYSIAISMVLCLFAFTCLLDDKSCGWLSKQFTKRPIISLLLACGITTCFADMHIAKFTVLSHRYMFPARMIKRIEPVINNTNTKLLITGGPYLLLFADEFYKEYMHPRVKQKVYWLLPSSGQQVEIPQDRLQAKEYLNPVLTSHSDVLLMSVPPYIKYNNKTKQVSLHLFKSKLSFTAHLKKVIYDVGQHRVILANQLKLHEAP